MQESRLKFFKLIYSGAFFALSLCRLLASSLLLCITADKEETWLLRFTALPKFNGSLLPYLGWKKIFFAALQFSYNRKRSSARHTLVHFFMQMSHHGWLWIKWCISKIEFLLIYRTRAIKWRSRSVAASLRNHAESLVSCALYVIIWGLKK